MSIPSLLLAVLFAAQSAPAPEELRRKAETMKPLPSELRWRKIPWGIDLLEAQRLARDERRPFLLWASGDDPLERC